MTDAGPRHVACAVVGDYLPHAAAMLASLVANGGEPQLVVHLLHDDSVALSDRRRLGEMLGTHDVPLDCLRIDDALIAGLPTQGFTGKGSWYRAFLPELLPDVERLLYLDADLLVLRPITPLRDVDLTDGYLAAVTNVFEPTHRHRPEELGLAHPDRYFNAGVLLMNLAAMRRDDCMTRVVDYGVRNAEALLWRDQDALNVVLGEARVPLHPRWNCMNSIMHFPQSAEVFDEEELADARRAPAIRHFEGPLLNKPWHYLAPPDVQRLYREHRAATPWPQVDLEDRTIATTVIRRLPAHARTPAYLRLLRWRGLRTRVVGRAGLRR